MDEECAICTEPLCNAPCAALPGCGHSFHTHCVMNFHSAMHAAPCVGRLHRGRCRSQPRCHFVDVRRSCRTSRVSRTCSGERGNDIATVASAERSPASQRHVPAPPNTSSDDRRCHRNRSPRTRRGAAGMEARLGNKCISRRHRSHAATRTTTRTHFREELRALMSEPEL